MRPFCADFCSLLVGHSSLHIQEGGILYLLEMCGCPCDSHVYFIFHFSHQLLIPHLLMPSSLKL